MDLSFSNYQYPPVTDLSFPAEWEPSVKDQTLFGAVGDSYNITTSSPQAEQANSMIALGQWSTENGMNYQDDDFEDDQEMRDQVNVFDSQPLEELFNNALYLENDDYQNIDQGGFLDPLVNVDTTDLDLDDSASDSSIGLPLEERYKVSLEKLQASMKRSQETRNCLTMKTSATESYERLGSVKELMTSIATSSGQVQKYVTSIKRPI
jgi:hypothetical protein